MSGIPGLGVPAPVPICENCRSENITITQVGEIHGVPQISVYCHRCGHTARSHLWGYPGQGASPGPPGRGAWPPPPRYAPYPVKKGPGALSVMVGLVTILVSILCLVLIVVGGIASVFYSGGMDMSGLTQWGIEGTGLTILCACGQALFAFFGVVAGALLAFRGGAAGKVFAAIFWSVVIVIGIIVVILAVLLAATLGFFVV